ncbi:MAG: type II toxin-antitoxin system VapB family antitoxin [Deltaproteobacteria bacterium]|nr:type II toxin-antitoxin system VapB family antitoxin [Deltaproteobacteria bacterium]
MRTTIRLDDRLLAQARREAARRGETLTALIEEGVRLVLARPRAAAQTKRVVLPVSTATGGTLPGVDLDNGAALIDLIEGR